MHIKRLGGGALFAGLLLFLGLVALPATTPGAQAQTPDCPDVDEGEVERCVVIAKLTDPDDDTSTDFEFEFDNTDFSLENGEQVAFELEDGETHVITESETDGWTLASIDCEDDEGVDVDEDVDEGSVSITVTAEEDEDALVTCTFVNEQDATPTATATTTTTATPTTTATASPTSTTRPQVTTTVVPPTAISGGTISPPSTGSGGLK